MARLRIILVFAACLSVLLVIAVVRNWGAGAGVSRPTIEPAAVRCLVLTHRPYTLTESFHGLIQAQSRVDMSFQVAGRVVQLGPTKDKSLREDDVVEVDTVLAMIEPQRYQAAVDQAKAQMQEAQAVLAEIDAQIADAQAWLADANSELERVRKLFEGRVANPREVEKAELNQKVNQAKLDAANARRASASASYNSAQAALTMAQVNLDDATLRAPMRARVAAVPAEVGQMVMPGTTIISLVDISQVKLVVGVVERKLPLLGRGQKVEVSVEALASQARRMRDAAALSAPRRGTVVAVPPAADPVTGLFNVEIALPNEDQMLKPGMIGRAVVTVKETQAVAIPADAAIRIGERAWAFFVTDTYTVGLDLGQAGKASIRVPTHVARRIAFDPDIFDNDEYLIPHPPVGFDRVVVEGQERLVDNQPVRVVLDSITQAGP